MSEQPDPAVQTWTVLEWSYIDGDVLGALIVCVECGGSVLLQPGCKMCNGQGTLHQPYRLPNGEPLDLYRHAELLIQIESTDNRPAVSDE